MNIKDKWISANSPDDPVPAAARRAIQQRWHCVQHFHPLAARRADENVEYVHQLRVSCRRAVAALETFHPLTGPRKAAKVSKWLRRIRRSGGDARDLDVLSLQLESDGNLSDSKRRRYLSELADCRESAQKTVKRCFQRAQEKELAKRAEKLLASIRWRGSEAAPTMETFARTAFDQRMHVFLEKAGGDLSDYASLHQFRIETKRLRYAMELLAAGFHDAFRKQFYPLVEDLQERLGRVNDYAAASQRCAKWLAGMPGNRDVWMQLAQQQDAAAERAAAEFLAWWDPTRIQTFRDHWRSLPPAA